MRMKQIAEEVRKGRARMQYPHTMAYDKLHKSNYNVQYPHMMANDKLRKSNYNVQYPHMMANDKLRKSNYNVQYRHRTANDKLCKSSYNVKDQQGNLVIRKIKQQVTKDGKVGQQTTDAMKGKFPRVMSPKSVYAFSLKKLVKSLAYKSNASISL
jgi:hypothetical protein